MVGTSLIPVLLLFQRLRAARSTTERAVGAGLVPFGAMSNAEWRIEEFLRSLTAVAPPTRIAYRRDVEQFADWLGRASVEEPTAVTRLLVRRYLAFAVTSGLATKTVARRASSLRRYFKWLHRRGHIDTDPTVGLSAPKGESRLPRVLRADEVAGLLDSAIEADDTPTAWRDRALLELLYGSGLRVAEACGLARSDVDLVAGTVDALGKGAKVRRVPLSGPAIDALRQWFDTARAEFVKDKCGGVDEAANLVFLNMRGRPLSPRDARRIVDKRATQPTSTAPADDEQQGLRDLFESRAPSSWADSRMKAKRIAGKVRKTYAELLSLSDRKSVV